MTTDDRFITREIRVPMIPISEVLEDFSKHHVPTLKPKSVTTYRLTIQKHLIPAFGEIPVGELRSRHIAGYLEERFSEDKQESWDKMFRWAELTMAVLSSAIRWYWREYEIDGACPARHIWPELRKLKKRKAIRLPKREALSSTQLSKILHIAKKADPFVFHLYALGAGVGLRLGEILGLEWENVDWKHETVTPVYAIQRDDRVSLLKSGNEGNPRVVPGAVMDILKRRRSWFERKKLPRWVLAEEDGKVPLYKSTIVRIRKVRLLAAKEGVPIELSFHSTRHTFATRAVREGWDWECLRRQLGHANALMTANVYINYTGTRPAVSMPELDFGEISQVSKR